MNDQQRNEVVKALAYGKTPEEIARVEGIALQDVVGIEATSGPEIAGRRAELQKEGYVNGDHV